MGFPDLYKPAVTDKAIIAWLEHVHGLNTAEVRREILADKRGAWIAWGATRVSVPQLRVDLMVDRGVITNIHTHDWGTR